MFVYSIGVVAVFLLFCALAAVIAKPPSYPDESPIENDANIHSEDDKIPVRTPPSMLKGRGGSSSNHGKPGSHGSSHGGRPTTRRPTTRPPLRPTQAPHTTTRRRPTFWTSRTTTSTTTTVRTTTVEPKPGPIEKCVAEQKVVNVPDRTRCNVYHVCQPDGSFVEKTCPIGEKFDHIDRVCKLIAYCWATANRTEKIVEITQN